MSLASMLSALFIFCYELYYLSYYLLAPSMLAAQLAVRFVSAIVFSGIICKLAGDAPGQDRRGQELRHRQRGQGGAYTARKTDFLRKAVSRTWKS